MERASAVLAPVRSGNTLGSCYLDNCGPTSGQHILSYALYNCLILVVNGQVAETVCCWLPKDSLLQLHHSGLSYALAARPQIARPGGGLVSSEAQHQPSSQSLPVPPTTHTTTSTYSDPADRPPGEELLVLIAPGAPLFSHRVEKPEPAVVRLVRRWPARSVAPPPPADEPNRFRLWCFATPYIQSVGLLDGNAEEYLWLEVPLLSVSLLDWVLASLRPTKHTSSKCLRFLPHW